jgi:adenine C2-methylase RlmN of 23S rRNA A2503 and tRNA A37
MYTEHNKGFTVITNFGCDSNCRYCITKHHPILQNAITDKTKIDWGYLEECISKSDAPTVNLSGGGDPFYNWENNYDFYNHIYDIATKYDKKLDIHTRVLPTDISLIQLFRKIALSIESNDVNATNRLKDRLPEIEKTTKIRVVNVLNERMTKEDCVSYISKMKQIGVKQITFRQMFGNKSAYKNFNCLKNEISEDGVLFLSDGEYHNYYFTTNNKLYPYFFGYTEEDRKLWMKRYEDIEQSCG